VAQRLQIQCRLTHHNFLNNIDGSDR
jgi:hypothetical protein